MNFALRRAKFFYRVLKSRLTGSHFPLLVTWSLSSRCNFRCHYCYGVYENRPPQDFPPDLALKFIDYLASHGTQFIQWSGGEPLLYPHLEALVDRALKYEICMGMSTNGTQIQKKLSLVKKIQTICVSLDGDQIAHEKNRGPHTFTPTIDGIEAALGAGVKTHIYCTLSRHNVNSLDWVMGFCRERKIYAEFGFLVSRGLKNDDGYQDMDLSPEEFKDAVTQLIAYKKEGYPILFSRQVMEKVRAWPDFEMKTVEGEPPTFNHIPCHQGKLMIFVDSDTKVYPCIQKIGNFPALSLKDDGFEQAILKAGEHNCQACYLMCVNDFNLLFELNPQVIWNNTKITAKELLGR